MPTKKKPVRNKKKGNSAKPKTKNGVAASIPDYDPELAKAFAEDEARRGYTFETWVRVMRTRKLPQGCTPAEKLAAIKALADLHGVHPVEDPESMMAPGFWPEHESVDEFVDVIRALRRQGK